MSEENDGAATGAPPTPPPPTPGSDSTPGKGPGRHWLKVSALVLALAFAAVVIAGNFIHMPYVIISPGEATALDSRVITIDGTPTYRHAGDLLFLTVRVTNSDPSLWRYLFAKADDDVNVQKKSNVIGGCATYDENARLNDLLMTQSQDVAKTVALRRLGYTVVDGASRAVIADVNCGGPSQGRLMLGDVITAIDGNPVGAADTVKPLVLAHKVGDEVRVTLDRAGTTKEVTVRLGRNPAYAALGGVRGTTAFMGIATQTVTDEQFPVDVRIDTRRVSGPSAGLAFTLAIIDDLTPGNLTGGKRVAVTGSILPDGGVAPVGGVEQKTITARRQGATLMLVPAGEAKAAREHADGMRIVVVKTVADALAALHRAGGAAVPAVPGQ
jgi:PDZ domain-containing protein